MANTGRVEKEQRDANPNSPTFGETRWVDAGQDVTACPLPQTFRSRSIQENVTKNNCPAGQYGSTILVTLAAGAYTSTVSLLDADTQARTAFDAMKQDYANQNGTCSTNPDTATVWLPQYDSNGCFACSMSNRDDPSDVRGATQQEVARYFAPFGPNQQPCPECF